MTDAREQTYADTCCTCGVDVGKDFCHLDGNYDDAYELGVDHGEAAFKRAMRDELVPVAMELYRAMMGDGFDAKLASRLPEVLMAAFGEIEGWHYD